MGPVVQEVPSIMASSSVIKKRFFFSIALGLVVFLALSVFGDARQVGHNILNFRWLWLPVVLGLSLVNYLVRFVKWHYYLKVVAVDLSLKNSFVVFMSGLTMAITPGKFGELVKAYFVKEMTGQPMSRTAPVILAERFTDFIAIVLLAAFGAFAFGYGQVAIFIGLAIILAILIIIMNRQLASACLRLLSRVQRIQKLSAKLSTLYESTYVLLKIKPLLITTILSIGSWFAECLGFYLVLSAMDVHLGLGFTTFAYAFATLLGALSFLPGGLLATEGSITGLLMLQGISKDVASAATLIIRGATLWFAVLVGLCWLLPNQRRLLTKLELFEEKNAEV